MNDQKYQSGFPETKDLFESQGHEIVAKTICRTITTELSENSNINIIGLEGALGSGKSTIVNLVSEELALNHPEYKVIPIDLDRYQSVIRQAIITKVSTEIQSFFQQHEDKEALQEIISETDIILGNKRKFKKSTSTTLLPKTVKYAFLLMLIPAFFSGTIPFLANIDYATKENYMVPFVLWVLCLLFLSLGFLGCRSKPKIKKNTQLGENNGLVSKTVKYAFLLMLIPTFFSSTVPFLANVDDVTKGYNMVPFVLWGVCLLLLSLVFLDYRSKSKMKKNTQLEENNTSNSPDGILTSKSEEQVSEEVLIRNEIGPLELEKAFILFDKYLDTINEKAKASDKNVSNNNTKNKLLLVFDNLDRLAVGKVQTVWSELEIFSSFESNNILILLPYSAQHVIKSLNANDLVTAREYITKRLPIIFTVPPVVTAGWEKRLSACYRETLGELPDVQGVIDIINIWHPKGKEVTPRYLAMLINNIRSHYEVYNTIQELEPLDSPIHSVIIAAYLLTKERELIGCKLNPPTTLNHLLFQIGSINNNMLAQEQVLNKYYDKQESWQQQLLCIHYQTTASFAVSEFLEQPLLDAIQQKDVDMFVEKLNYYGFENYFERLYLDYPYEIKVIVRKAFAKELDKEQKNKIAHCAEKLFSSIKNNRQLKVPVDQLFNTQHTTLHLKNIYEEFFDDFQFLQGTIENLDLFFIEQIQTCLIYCLNVPAYIIQEEMTVRFLYRCCQILNYHEKLSTLIRITDKNIHAIWCERNILKNWDIESELANVTFEDREQFIDTSLNILSREISSPPSTYQVAACELLEFYIANYKLGEYTKINRNINCDNFNFSIALLYYIKWGDNKTQFTTLSTLYNTAVNNKDKKAIHRIFAKIIAFIVENYHTFDQFIRDFFQNNAHRFEEKFSEALQSLDYKEYLTDCFVMINDFTKIVRLHNEKKQLVDFSKNICELIQKDRVAKLDTAQVLNNQYNKIKNITQPITQPDLLDWLAKFELLSPKDWCPELLNDLKIYPQDKFIECVTSYFHEKKDSPTFPMEMVNNMPHSLALLGLLSVIPNQEVIASILKNVEKCIETDAQSSPYLQRIEEILQGIEAI